MAETAAATIRIGGPLWRGLLPAFRDAIEADRARVDYDGGWFSEEDLPDDEPLQLFSREANGGRFANVEAFCVAHKLPFIRWCEARAGEWDAEHVAYPGEGEPLHFLATDKEDVALTAAELRSFKTLDELHRCLASATPQLPSFDVIDVVANSADDAPVSMTDPGPIDTTPMIPPEVRAAVDCLFDLAHGDTDQACRVADFLLAWWNAGRLGGFDVADLFSLDRAIGADMAAVFAFLAAHPRAIYASALGRRDDVMAMITRWRPRMMARIAPERG